MKRMNRKTVLDKILEVHEMMKIYEDSKIHDLGPYNKVNMLL
jgi:hypothetical protein